MTDITKTLSEAWDSGFFYKIRSGEFDEAQYSKLKEALSKFQAPPGATLEKDFVSMVWFIPLFINWHEKILLEKGMSRDRFSEVEDFFYNKVEEILGLP
jgi:hypothetical protein